jgi:hypothetical protein
MYLPAVRTTDLKDLQVDLTEEMIAEAVEEMTAEAVVAEEAAMIAEAVATAGRKKIIYNLIMC